MSSYATTSPQPEGSGSAIMNPQMSQRTRKRGSTEESTSREGKKRKVNQNSNTGGMLTPPTNSRAVKKAPRRRKQSRINIDAVPPVNEQAALMKRERDRRERELRCQQREAKKMQMQMEQERLREQEEEQERLREQEEEEERIRQQEQHQREYEVEAEQEFNRICQQFRLYANSFLATGDLTPQQREQLEQMRQMTADVFINSGRYTEGGADEEPERCSICLEQFVEDGEVAYFRGCQHIFHDECVSEWLTHDDSCPNCRNPTVNLYSRRQ